MTKRIDAELIGGAPKVETEKMSGGSWRIIRRVILVIFDIFAVNISYYGALVIRFYVSGAFNVSTTN